MDLRRPGRFAKPVSFRSTGGVGDPHEFRGRGDRVGGPENRPTHHQQIRTEPGGGGGVQNPGLVVVRIRPGPDAGRDEVGFRSQGLSHGGQFPRRENEAVGAPFDRRGSQPDRGLFRGVSHPEAPNVVRRQTRQHGDRDDAGPSFPSTRAFDGRADHGGAAGGVDGDQRGAHPGGEGRGFPDDTGDIVELQIEKDAELGRREPSHDIGAAVEKEDGSDLHPGHDAPEPVGQGQGGAGLGDVEGDGDFRLPPIGRGGILHGAGRVAENPGRGQIRFGGVVSCPGEKGLHGGRIAMLFPEPRDDEELAAIRERAEGYLMLGLHEEALRELSRLRDRGEDELFADYLEGLIRRGMGDMEEARRIFEGVLNRRPDLTAVHIDLAYVYRRCDSMDRAMSTLRRALDLDPSLGLAYYNLACYQAVDGRPDLALGTLARAIRENAVFRGYAVEDEDFDSLQDDPRFLYLVEGDLLSP